MRCLWRYVIISIVLAACSPAVPPRPTVVDAIGVTASPPASTPAPSVTGRVTPEATTAAPPVAAETRADFAAAPLTRMAVVDQTSAVDTSRAGWWSIHTLRPVGQTFKPSFAGLDAIELWIEDQWKAECAGTGAGLQVTIREATMAGPVIGTSAPVVLPDCFTGVAHFGFPTLVALTPNNAYLIEVIGAAEDNWGVVWQQVPDAYPRGESLALGAAGEADLWFRAGLRESTPPTEAYCQHDLWRHVRRTDGSAFTNQSDCSQYVKTRR